MVMREAIEAALASWRDAERRQAQVVDGDRERLTAEVECYRAEFQRLSAEHMVEWIAKLQEAEGRRSHSTPSTPPFHEAARDAQAIAAEIWETARESDEDTPQTAASQRTASKPGIARS
jgi:L-lactate utilization protein LutC